MCGQTRTGYQLFFKFFKRLTVGQLKQYLFIQYKSLNVEMLPWSEYEI